MTDLEIDQQKAVIDPVASPFFPGDDEDYRIHQAYAENRPRNPPISLDRRPLRVCYDSDEESDPDEKKCRPDYAKAALPDALVPALQFASSNGLRLLRNNHAPFPTDPLMAPPYNAEEGAMGLRGDEWLDDIPQVGFELPIPVEAPLLGWRRLAAGLTGMAPGPSPQLLAALEADGVDGRWNDAADTEPWKPISKLFFPGHETFKYFKNGTVPDSGQATDFTTISKWGRLANMYAPKMAGVPSVMEDDDPDRFGTLDWSLIRNRPNTTLDEMMQRATWFDPNTGERSLWRDGLVAPPGQENYSNLTWGVTKGDPPHVAATRTALYRGPPPETRRQALPMVTAAVDMLRLEYKNMLKTKDCQPPQILSSILILDVLGSKWLEQNPNVDVHAVHDFLKKQNSALQAWPDSAWSDSGLSFQALSKARSTGFFLGCHEGWVMRDVVDEGHQLIDKDMEIEGVGKIRGASTMIAFSRTVACETEGSDISLSANRE